MKKGLTSEPGRKMVVLDERTIAFYDPRIEQPDGRPLPKRHAWCGTMRIA
jgi:hypothetical protein